MPVESLLAMLLALALASDAAAVVGGSEGGIMQ